MNGTCKYNKLPVGVLMTMMLGSAMTTAAAATFTEALTGGKPTLDARMRYEGVEQDNALKDASALTLRTRLGYRTQDYQGWQGFVEMENVLSLSGDDYNSTANGETGYSVIADPEDTELNQAFVSYAGMPDTQLTFGRQRIKLDNDRFIGNVGWRQNEQTFDAFKLVNTTLPDTQLTYSYIANVNQIFGEHNPTRSSDVEMKNHLVNLSYQGWDFAKLVGYGYFLDYVDKPASSQKTLGLRLTGGKPVADGVKLLYTAEYATQDSYRDGSDAIDADYLMAELGAKLAAVTVKFGYEVLGGDGSYGFSTPLATLHAFNGWTDQFLNTPADGLEDASVTVVTKLMGAKLLAVYHDFNANEGSAHYGSELGLLAVKKFGPHYSAGVKYASYNADELGVDTDKLWLWGGINFK